MPELKHDELSALNDAVAPLAEALAHGLTLGLGIEGTREPAVVTENSADDLLADVPTGIQLTFSFPTSLADEAMLAIRSDDLGTLGEALGWGAANPNAMTDDQMTALYDAMQAAAREMCSVAASPGEPGGLSRRQGTPQLPPSFAVPESAVRVAVPIQISTGFVEVLLFLTAARARAIMLDSLVNDGPAVQNGNGNGNRTSASSIASVVPYRPVDDMPQPDSLPRGMELLLDIPLEVSVELGRVRMLMKDVLELSPGSVVELERVAGEPVDLMVNGRLVAKGEVVVVEDNFGIRVTEIVSPADRLGGLSKRG